MTTSHQNVKATAVELRTLPADQPLVMHHWTGTVDSSELGSCFCSSNGREFQAISVYCSTPYPEQYSRRETKNWKWDRDLEIPWALRLSYRSEKNSIKEKKLFIISRQMKLVGTFFHAFGFWARIHYVFIFRITWPSFYISACFR